MLDKPYVTFAYPDWKNATIEININNQNQYGEPLTLLIELTKGCKLQDPPSTPGIPSFPGYDLVILISAIFAVTLIVTRKRMKKM